MIHELYISNYALIQEARLNFSNGFHVFTGETGAGKSIFLGALGLVMGKRADSSILIDKNKKCISEAIFHLESDELKPWFEAQELEFDLTCILRREIWPNGKSRGFINDSPVTIQQLKEFSDQVLDVHGQHETLSLKNKTYRLAWLDTISGSDLVAHEFSQAMSARAKLLDLKNKYHSEKAENQRKLDFLAHQLEEWQALKWNDGEQAELETRLEQLQQAESLQAALKHVLELLLEDQHIVDELRRASSIAQKLAPFVPENVELLNRLESARIDLADLGLELQRLETEFAPDPLKLNQLQERYSAYLNVLRKHHCMNESEMVTLSATWLKEKTELERVEMAQDEWDKEIQQWDSVLLKLGTTLTKLRTSGANEAEAAIRPILSELGLHDSTLSIQLNSLNQPTAHGFEEVQFLYSPHPKLEAKPLENIASGGELSRIMLIFKLLAAKKKVQPTLIFDEIDTGISGKIAGKMGQLLNGVGTDMQIMAITHLPQIASKGKRHFKVEKVEGSTRIRELSHEERITELAGMLSAEITTENALEHARELLKTN